MLEISNVSVSGLRESIIACRNAMRTTLPEYTDEEFEKGIQRAMKLSEMGGGSGHKIGRAHV